MKYAVTFTNPETGEQREVVVSLEDIDREARAFLQRNRITRPGAGAPGGPIERTLAYGLARPRVPSDFVYNIEAPGCCCLVH
jgi:hypothetical protein